MLFPLGHSELFLPSDFGGAFSVDVLIIYIRHYLPSPQYLVYVADVAEGCGIDSHDVFLLTGSCRPFLIT